MSFVGAGAEDWPELDINGVEFDARVTVRALVEDHREQLERLVRGPIDIEDVAGGRVHLLVDGERRLLAQVSASGRLMITRMGESDLL